jgi:tRNA G18 (ribose-2'-O)-methylase SpoU
VIHEAADARLHVTIQPRSLNVSVAAGIVLSGALRQIGARFEEAAP